MGKYILLGWCWLMLFYGFGKAAGQPGYAPQPAAFSSPQPDTLSIEHDIALQPFRLDTISPEAIKHLFGEGWVVKKQPIRNRFVKGQIDTLITIRKSRSYICLYAVSKADKNFYQSAIIRDPLPVFQENLLIGQSKKEIQALFPELQHIRVIPDLIRIAAGEAGDSLYLFFENGILRKVAFKPYLD